jgi:hypothetical protein
VRLYDLEPFRVLSSLFVQIAGVFMHIEHPSELSRLSRIAAYYLTASTFYAIIWSARLSILFSIIRIDPDASARQRLKRLAALFIGAFAFLLAQLFWTCEGKNNGWKNTASPQCRLPKLVAICQLVCMYSLNTLLFFRLALRSSYPSLRTADIFADLSLILLPIRLIRGFTDKGLRWRLIFIFSTSSSSPFSPLFT